MTHLDIQKGNILLAEPSITGDVSFSRAVILLAEHNKEGSVGFILNKPLSNTLNELVTDIDIPFPIFNGGPVEQDNLYFIHMVPELIKGSIEICDGIYWGGNFDSLTEAINKKTITDSDIRFFLGYSGWTSLQLLKEIKANSWIPIEDSDIKSLVKRNSLELWKEKIKEIGGAYLIWSNTPENPNLN